MIYIFILQTKESYFDGEGKKYYVFMFHISIFQTEEGSFDGKGKKGHVLWGL